MKRVIVTGATGFVGANLARRLLRQGHELHLLVRPGYSAGRIQAIRDSVSLHEVDLGDPEALVTVVRRIHPDWVFHLAAHGAYSWQTDLRRMIQTNIAGTVNLVEACLASGFEAFVNTGSSSEYGFKDHAPNEDGLPDPNSYYSVTKCSATLFSRYAARSHRENLHTLRLYSVYGAFEDPGRLIPTIIRYGMQGELPPLADPTSAHDYVYVEDACDAYLLVARSPGQEPGSIYNVGTGVQTTLREVVEVARRTLRIEKEPQWGSLANYAWDTNVWVADSRKIQNELGWRPRHGFEEGFRLTAKWFRVNSSVPEQQTSVRSDGQLRGRLRT
jgi:nucleoside-diphosphate-sugar epimerase